MPTKQPSWEGTILLFAVAVTALTGVAYRMMLTYNLTIAAPVWVALVVGPALLALGLRYVASRRRR